MIDFVYFDFVVKLKTFYLGWNENQIGPIETRKASNKLQIGKFVKSSW